MKNIQLIKKSLLLLFTSIVSCFSFAQVTEEWVRSYNGLPEIDIPFTTSVVTDGQGNVIVAGQNVDANTGIGLVVTKYDSDGNVLWVTRSLAADFFRALAVDASGNIYVTGEGVSGGLFDYVTIKYNPAGDELWTKTYNGPGNGSDVPASIAVDASGGVYVTGASFGGSETLEDYATIKYDAVGNQLWVQRFNGGSGVEDMATALAVDASGNVYVSGVSNGAFATIKYSTNGSELWVEKHSGNGAVDVAVDASGNVYVLGGIDTDFATIKYDTNGNELWLKTYNGPANGSDIAHLLAVDASGNVYVTGQSIGVGTGVDFATIKYNTNGDQIWVKRYNGPANSTDAASSVAVDANGNVYVTGFSNGIGTNSDFATIKYDAGGTELWEVRYNGAGNSFDGANAIVVDASGNVYVTGESAIDENNTDYTTIKYVQEIVTDVSCGKKGDKVMVCHKGNVLCISKNAVDAHLRHGDQLGSCSVLPLLNDISEQDGVGQFMEQAFAQFSVSVAPNPFNMTTRLQYQLPADGEVSIKVYDVLGREVASVVKSVQKAGVYNASFNATDLTKGVYYFRALLTTQQQKVYTQTGKLMVVK